MKRPLLRRAMLVADWLLARIVIAGFAAVRLLSPERASALGGAVARAIGPLLPGNRHAAENIRLAFPELTAADRAKILRGAWDNLGREACEYAHIDHLSVIDFENPEAGRIEATPEIIEKFLAMRDDGKPALVFSAHLANWEITAVAAKRYGLPAAALYRTPNNRFIAERILGVRSELMRELIPAGPGAPFRMADLLGKGFHVGMLMDQRFGRGTKVPFFGRPAATNPIFAKLARHIDCPVYGARAIRLPGARFRLELEGPIELPRDAKGRIDEKASTDAITGIIEGWVREYPEQWLWQHRRWRM